MGVTISIAFDFLGRHLREGIFRPPFGWKYNYFLHEAVDEVPEYVVPWEAFRALAEEVNLEMQYHKPFAEVWETEKDDRELGPLSERMGVRESTVARCSSLPKKWRLLASTLRSASTRYDMPRSTPGLTEEKRSLVFHG